MIKLKNLVNSLELSVNNFCALQCEGCPSLPLGSSRSNLLDLDKTIPIIEKLSIERIVLCGNDGEPLEREDIAQALGALAKSFPEARIQVSTNGEKLIERFSPSQLKGLRQQVFFEIAVDGSDQETHQLTRKGGSLNRVFDAIEFLIREKFPFHAVASRHRDNESDNMRLASTLKSRFGIELRFRDTSIVNTRVRPPSWPSKNANVEVLYHPPRKGALNFTPNHKHMFINSNGDCYPCVSFVKWKTRHLPVNIYAYEKASDFFAAFKRFQKTFCETYQEEGDIRQCQLNCGIFSCAYHYDTIEDLEGLRD